jgi:hypothetical protein
LEKAGNTKNRMTDTHVAVTRPTSKIGHGRKFDMYNCFSSPKLFDVVRKVYKKTVVRLLDQTGKECQWA